MSESFQEKLIVFMTMQFCTNDATTNRMTKFVFLVLKHSAGIYIEVDILISSRLPLVSADYSSYINERQGKINTIITCV